MKDTRRCIICECETTFRKNEGICSPCRNDIANFRRKVRGVILTSLKYGTNSYIWNHLPYSVSDLKAHLENQFEPWMNWNNHGIYVSKTWNELNPKTWTWQIDHIIPQVNFIFTSVRDENFRDCWSLVNLRPIASKLNAKKGIKEIV